MDGSARGRGCRQGHGHRSRDDQTVGLCQWCFFAGLGGTLFAAKLSSTYPQSFQFLVSINVLSLIIIGGMGSIPGVLVGSFALVGMPELLREFAEYRYLVYGAVLVAMMLTRPEGLIPEARRGLELHEAEEEAGTGVETPPAPNTAAGGR